MKQRKKNKIYLPKRSNGIVARNRQVPYGHLRPLEHSDVDNLFIELDKEVTAYVTALCEGDIDSANRDVADNAIATTVRQAIEKVAYYHKLNLTDLVEEAIIREGHVEAFRLQLDRLQKRQDEINSERAALLEQVNDHGGIIL